MSVLQQNVHVPTGTGTVNDGLFIGSGNETGFVHIMPSITTGVLNLASGPSRSGNITIGNAASSGPIIIDAGTGSMQLAGSTINAQNACYYNDGITVNTGTATFSDGVVANNAAITQNDVALVTTAGITNTNTAISSVPGITFGGSTLQNYVARTSFDGAVYSMSAIGTIAVTLTPTTHYTNFAGWYTRVGDLVHYTFRCQFVANAAYDAAVDTGGGTDPTRLIAFQLPIAPANSTFVRGQGNFASNYTFAGGVRAYEYEPVSDYGGRAFAYLHDIEDTALTYMTWASIPPGASSVMRFTLTYWV